MAVKGSRKKSPGMVSDSAKLANLAIEAISILQSWHPQSVNLPMVARLMAEERKAIAALAVSSEPEENKS